MKKSFLIVLITIFLVTSSGLFSFAQDTLSLPDKKQSKLGLYITAKEAYIKWLSDPGNVKIIDCRTPEEYIFVGHAPMAHNIPSKFVTHQIDKEKLKPIMEKNPDFVALVQKKFKPDDFIMIMCRSGARSAESVNLLAEAGFKHVYSIIDGFEGDKVKDPENCFYGKRFKNGWKNAGNPWTYKLDPVFTYSPDKEIKNSK